METHLHKFLPNLIGFFPVTTEGGGNDTELWLSDGTKICLQKKTKTVLKELARIFAKDICLVKRQAGHVLGYKRDLPLLISLDLVLIPVKVRNAQYKDQGTIGYCIFRGIDRVQPLKEGTYKAALVFNNSQTIFVLNTVQKLRQKLNEAGELIKQERQRLSWLQSIQLESCAEKMLEKY